MAKRKFRRHQHPISTRSIFERQYTEEHLVLDRHELLELIHGGEDTYVELKVRLNNIDKVAAEVVALANAGGGFIVFGVNDQRRIEGVEDPEWVESQLIELCRRLVLPPLHPYINKLSFDNGKRVVALEVNGVHRPYFTRERRCYTRTGSIKREATEEEISEMYHPHVSVGFELIPVLRATLDDIDEALFWAYVREVRGGDLGEFETRGYPVDVVMIKYLRLAVEMRQENVPTLAGLLLFGKNDRVAELLPRSGMVATRYAGTTVTDPIVEREELTGNLATVYERAIRFVERYTDLLGEEHPARSWAKVASPVEPRAAYFRPAVLEGVANALLHRDYSFAEATTRLLVFDDHLEVFNPRRSDGVAVESLCYGVVDAPHPRLKAVFKSPYYGLETPRGGLPMLLARSQAFSGLRPEIRLGNDEFRLKIYGPR
jgi:predicted HTH transcriptional regulator